MAETGRLLPGSDTEQLGTWTRIRHFAVPRSMIERCTAAREAGDWRAACAAGKVEVLFDLADVALEHGSDVAARLADDLRHLAPDLLRWHLPRVDSNNMTFEPRMTYLLAGYGAKPTEGPFLTVRSPDGVFLKQRLRLGLSPRKVRRTASTVWWVGMRHLWDVRHSDELRTWCGGGERAPFFEADGTPTPAPGQQPGPGSDPAALTEYVNEVFRRDKLAAACAVAGIEVAVPPVAERQWWVPEVVLGFLPLAPTQWATAFAALKPLGDRWVIWHDGIALVLDASRPDQVRGWVVPTADDADARKECSRLPKLPAVAAQRPVDLDLLVAGRLTPDDLHPLVHAALFPKRSTVDGQVGPPPPSPPKPVRVRCHGRMHQVTPEGGTLRLLSHSDEEVPRELAFAALSGDYSGCVGARRAWATGEGNLSRGLQKQRGEVFYRMLHGDADGVMAMLDAGFDHNVRDAGGRSLLHYLAKADHEELLPRLLAAGLDPAGRDDAGDTPLKYMAKFRPSAALVRNLAAAGGADPPDGWDWLTIALLTEYTRADPELAAMISARTGMEVPVIAGEDE